MPAQRTILGADCDCQGCNVPLFAGEVGYRDPETGIVACSPAHLADAVQEREDFDLIALFNYNFDQGGRVLA